jgi:hypothetical protein
MIGRAMLDHSAEARLEQAGRFFMGSSEVQQALGRLVRKLDDLAIPYAICGGMAVNAHGHHRTTTDVDVLVTPEGHAAFKAGAVGLGWVERFAGSRGLKDAESRVPIDFLLTGGVPGGAEPHGLLFPDPAAVAVVIAGKHYLSLMALLELKLASAQAAAHRLQDAADVIALVRLHSLDERFGDVMHPSVLGKWRELWALAQKSPDLPE